MWPLNSGDCLIEVTAWTGLTVVLKSEIESDLSFMIPDFLNDIQMRELNLLNRNLVIVFFDKISAHLEIFV